MFVDEIIIRVRSGAGGAGSASFRREKFVPRGGPDGGDGGRGGDVVLRATSGLNTLSHLRGRRVYAAPDGGAGGKSLRHGPSSDPVTILVPVGTVATNLESGDPLGELTRDGVELTVAEGGRGGRGNTHFAHSRNQAPKFAEIGEPAVEVQLKLELRLIADIGLVGAPNAGKSTLLKGLTAATPKIADYPFTTLEPNLGVVMLAEGDSRLVLADVPGLIEGASSGSGLGTAFLRHLSRTAVLVHVLDCSQELADCRRTWDATMLELREYDPELAGRVAVAALNKVDLPGARRRATAMTRHLRDDGVSCHAISAATGEGLDGLLEAVSEAHRMAGVRHQPRLRIYRPKPVREKIRIEKDGDLYRVYGRSVESVVAQTNVENPEALARMRSQLDVAGLRQALLDAGVEGGDTVMVGSLEFVFDPNL